MRKRISQQLYYDKRRVENILRRFLEHIEEWRNENEESEVDLGKLFDRYVAAAEKFEFVACWFDTWRQARGLHQHCRTDSKGPQRLLQGASVRCHRIPTLMTKSQFVERLMDVPFNVPDYPVPADKLTARHLSAGEVATYLAEAVLEADLKEHEVVGVGPSSRRKAVLKDFTACGLVSVEELQALLFAQIAVGREHARSASEMQARFGWRSIDAIAREERMRANRNSSGVDGELDLVVLELHNECKGPFVLSMLAIIKGRSMLDEKSKTVTLDGNIQKAIREEFGIHWNGLKGWYYKYRNSDGKVSQAYTNSSRTDVEDRSLMQELVQTVATVVDLDRRNGEFEFDTCNEQTLEKEAMQRETLKMIEWLKTLCKSYERGGKRNRPESTSAELALGIYKDIDEVRLKIRDDPTGDIAAFSLAESFLEHLQEYRAASGRREPKRKYRKVARRTVTARPRKILREELPVVVNEQHRAAVEEFMREAGVTASELRRSPPSQALKKAVRSGLCVYWHKEKGWHYLYLNPIGVFDDPQVSSAYVNSSRAESLRDNFEDLLQAVAIVTYLDSLPDEPHM
ncbi:hypothetical protein FOZ60_011329 [Perkinsus olseni]|uniref:Uncharacterized protein n=1 Tax=Perkinsus olseni TaxID=32597 RepID=A0A7J6NEQ9_PEROL|nr:hypothetical protein FOZ60_011329 [Perkinsus olseni]